MNTISDDCAWNLHEYCTPCECECHRKELFMRYHCHFCGKSVSSELPHDSVIRAILVCPECVEARKIIIPEDKK